MIQWETDGGPNPSAGQSSQEARGETTSQASSSYVTSEGSGGAQSSTSEAGTTAATWHAATIGQTSTNMSGTTIGQTVSGGTSQSAPAGYTISERASAATYTATGNGQHASTLTSEAIAGTTWARSSGTIFETVSQQEAAGSTVVPAASNAWGQTTGSGSNTWTTSGSASQSSWTDAASSSDSSTASGAAAVATTVEVSSTAASTRDFFSWQPATVTLPTLAGTIAGGALTTTSTTTTRTEPVLLASTDHATTLALGTATCADSYGHLAATNAAWQCELVFAALAQAVVMVANPWTALPASAGATVVQPHTSVSESGGNSALTTTTTSSGSATESAASSQSGATFSSTVGTTDAGTWLASNAGLANVAFPSPLGGGATLYAPFYDAVTTESVTGPWGTLTHTRGTGAVTSSAMSAGGAGNAPGDNTLSLDPGAYEATWIADTATGSTSWLNSHTTTTTHTLSRGRHYALKTLCAGTVDTTALGTALGDRTLISRPCAVTTEP